MATRSIADALADSPAAPLLARLARTRQIGRLLASVVAPLAPDFDATDASACELRDGTLLLNARSPAQAAKLRQGVPGMLRLLHQSGVQVTEIRVRVQPARRSYPERSDDPAQESWRPATGGSDDSAVANCGFAPPALAGAQSLARTLAQELPESPLRRAAQRLQASLARSAPDAGRGKVR